MASQIQNGTLVTTFESQQNKYLNRLGLLSKYTKITNINNNNVLNVTKSKQNI